MKKIFSIIIALVATLAVCAQTTKEYVDLGLPSGTLWATCNVGASAPEEYGNYFAWGETKPKQKYNVSTYKWCNGSIISMTKYNTDINYGIVDDKTELDPADDAATVNWGSEWCMPTAEEIEELYNLDYVTSEWSIQNGVKGRLITSKKNGNSIFLPVAGYRLDLSNGSLYEAGSNGYYWTNSCRTNSACILNFGMTAIGEMQYFNRAQGCSVRPVRVEKAVVSSIDDVTANQKATKSGKYISDGNLVIEKDGKLYNANGTKVK